MSYTRREFLKTIGITGAGILFSGCVTDKVTAEPLKKKPNIIVIMTDDMGFTDVGCYGGEIKTPNLDKLAANGIRFTQFYNTARCCPTRASILTGLYPHQVGVGHMMQDKGYDGYRGDLNKNCVTIAQVLKPAGYSSYVAGKWHVTRSLTQNSSKHNWPLQRGFDKFFGTLMGGGNYYDPALLVRDNTMIAPKSDDFYYTDAITDNAVKFIDEHDDNKPFFMYVAYTAPHWPLHAREKDIAKYKGRYDKGWDELRKERHARAIKLGLVDSKWPLTERDDKVPAWEDEKNKKWQARRMEVYAATVECMDRGIGRLADKLKQTGQLDNTLIMYLHDNGGCAEEIGSKGPQRPDPDNMKPGKPMGKDEPKTNARAKFTRDGRPVRSGHGVMPGPDDTYLSYGLAWANASNTPFRLYKHWVHEGGISTPLIVHWPDRIKDQGALRKQTGHIIDIMTTCADVAGAEYPKEFMGQKIKPMEGQSLLPVFIGSPEQSRTLYWEHEGNRAVRQGDWKLVAKGKKGPWELYNLIEDRTETNNLAEKHPEKTEKLAKMWLDYAKRANVLPLRPSKKRR